MSIKKLFLVLILFSFEKNIFPNSNEILQIHYNDRAPFFIKNKSKNLLDDGILYHLIKKILKNANIKYEFNDFSLPKSIILMKENKENICISYGLNDPTRNEFSQASLPYFKENPAITIKAGTKTSLKIAFLLRL